MMICGEAFMDSFISTFGLLLGAFAVIIGLLVFGKRVLQKTWWALGRLLNRLNPPKR